MMKHLLLVSSLIFAISLAAWADCTPANGVFTYAGGCLNTSCTSVEAYTLGDGKPCDNTDTYYCTVVPVSVTGNDYLPGSCTTTSDCTLVLTNVQKSANGGAISGPNCSG